MQHCLERTIIGYWWSSTTGTPACCDTKRDHHRHITVGDDLVGLSKIYTDNKIDVAAGKPGYQRVEGKVRKNNPVCWKTMDIFLIMSKSDPEEIYAFFEYE